MTYIYDILLNFSENKLIEFYEWNQKDKIINIKKIPIFRISSQQLYDLIHFNIRVEEELLDKIKEDMSLSKKENLFDYIALFTDINRVIGISFNKDGYINYRSGLLLDEEEDVIIECRGIVEEEITYQKLSKLNNNFYTREEIKRINYILQELEKIYKDENKEKLNYLYNEIFPKQRQSFKNKYLKMKEEIENNYSSKYNILYEILKLSYTKK